MDDGDMDMDIDNDFDKKTDGSNSDVDGDEVGVISVVNTDVFEKDDFNDDDDDGVGDISDDNGIDE